MTSLTAIVTVADLISNRSSIWIKLYFVFSAQQFTKLFWPELFKDKNYYLDQGYV